MDHNPYAPPAAAVTDIVNTRAVFSPRQILVAAFLGSPIAATWLIHRNFMTLGDASRGLRALWLGTAVSVAVLAVAFYLPQRIPDVLLPLIYSVALYQYALHRFGAAYRQHLTAGGRTGSWWSVLGVSLLAVLILVGILFALVFAAPSMFNGP
jgi:hypothetical protein